MTIDLDVVARLIGGVASVVAAALAVRRTMASALESSPRLRSALKADADLLSKLPKDGDAYAILSKNMEERIRRQYPSAEYPAVNRAPSGDKKQSWLTIVLGAAILIGFGTWTYLLVRDGFTPWALLTGFLALGGFGILMDGWNELTTGAGDSDQIPRAQTDAS
jgi:hypothetical protein